MPKMKAKNYEYEIMENDLLIDINAGMDSCFCHIEDAGLMEYYGFLKDSSRFNTPRSVLKKLKKYKKVLLGLSCPPKHKTSDIIMLNFLIKIQRNILSEWIFSHR
jgi:hypothetical protein